MRGSGLGQNFPADHIRRPNVAQRVANSYVLNDGASSAVGRIRPHDGALLGEYSVHFTYDLTGIISDQHRVLLRVDRDSQILRIVGKGRTSRK